MWWAEPPPKVRIPAPKSIAPKIETADPAKIVDCFFRLQDEWARLLRQAERDRKTQARSQAGRLTASPWSFGSDQIRAEAPDS